MTDTQLLKQGSVRIWIQEDGINPLAPYRYYGCMMMDSPNQDLGTPDPIYCPSSEQRNKWDIVDDVPKAPALGTFDFTQHAGFDLREIWMQFKRRGCKVNLQVLAGSCQRPDDFSQWDAKEVYLDSRLSNLGHGGLNPLSGDDNAVVDWTGSFNFRDWDVINQIKFAEVADSTIVAEVLDGFYYDTAQCGDCGTPSDGCNLAYLLTAANTGSPGLSSQLLYSINGGDTWAGLDINSLAGKTANRAAAMGNKIIVVSQASDSHHWAPISSILAGTVGAWTQVSTGYVAAKGPRAIYVKNSSQAFIAAAGGYIYYLTSASGQPSTLTDGSVTTQDLNDINGNGNTIVAVGGNNAVLVSSNGGNTFSLVTGPAVGVNLTAIWCLSATTWLIGAGNGKLYCTLNSGSTWTEISLGLAGITVINDIRFFDGVVGYVAAEVAGAGVVFRSTDSGNTWSNQAPDISSLPTSQRINFAYPCGRNNVLVGGRKTVGGDGLAAIATN